MSRPYRVLVTGSRDWWCRGLVDRVIAGLMVKHEHTGFIIVHGACPSGIDACFDYRLRYYWHLDAERHPADWRAHGRAAGPIRNQLMVDLGADLCLAFSPLLPVSGGTVDCVRRAIAAGIPTWWTSTDGVPKKLNNHPHFASEKGG